MGELQIIALLVAFAGAADLFALRYLSQRKAEKARQAAERAAEMDRQAREAHEAALQMPLPFSGEERRYHERRGSGQEAARA
jgi:cellobiose-specific phosphotransferase system component IIA